MCSLKVVGFESAPQEAVVETADGKIERFHGSVAAALSVAKNLAPYKPRAITPPTPLMKDYVEGRNKGFMKYDRDVAKPLGEWFYETQRTIASNSSSLELLIWAKEHLDEAGLKDYAAKVDRAIEYYRNYLLTVPYPFMRDVLDAKEKDANERIARERGNAY